MRTKSLFFSFLAFAFLLHFQWLIVAQQLAGSESEALELAGSKAERETLEIIIGGGGGGGIIGGGGGGIIGGGGGIIGGGGGSSPAPSHSPACPPSRLERARRVLLKFKTLIDDPNCYTRNWNEQTDTCNFKGIRCGRYPNSNERAVAGLDFNQAGFAGKNCDLSLSGILDSIPELTFYHTNSNNFSGRIPNKIITYPYFFELDLSNNKLAGEFPKEVLQARQLVFLDLRFNRYYGSVPSQLFEMDLDVIFINNNRFSEYLPENFGSTPARFLTFANNQFTGPIPRSIGDAAKTLTEVLFLGNKFDGCLPYEIGYLRKATVFDVSKNLLTGPIPSSFACLEKIQYLNLAHNKFYGVVPESVCLLPGIRNNGNLYLSDNYFTELAPACWNLIKSKVLDVNNNCIPGLPNQRSREECYEFLYKVKPCSNHQSLTYIPCKAYSQEQELEQEQKQKQSNTPVSHATDSAPGPVTYKSLKPHRLRL